MEEPGEQEPMDRLRCWMKAQTACLDSPVSSSVEWIYSLMQTLPEDLKAQIDDLYVIHDYQDALVRSGITYPLVAHPIVRTHPETGEDILWVNFGLKPRIVDLDKAESDALLARLYTEVKRPEYHARFRWRKNSVAIWDNRAGLHYAVRDYGDYPRVMERVLIAGDDIPHRVRKPSA